MEHRIQVVSMLPTLTGDVPRVLAVLWYRERWMGRMFNGASTSGLHWNENSLIGTECTLNRNVCFVKQDDIICRNN